MFFDLTGQETKKDSLLSLIESSEDPIQKIGLIISYSKQFNDNSTRLHDLLNEALAIADKHDLQNQKIYALSAIGFNALSQGNYTKAQDYYHQSSLLSIETGDSLEYFWAQQNLALVNYYLKNYKKAEEIYLANEVFPTHRKDTALLAGLYNNLGMVYSETKQFQLSLQYYQKAYKLKKAINSPDLLNSLNNMGETYFKMDSLVMAEKIAREFHSLAYKGESVLYHTVADLNLGSILVKTNNPKQALPYLLKALEYSRKYQFKSFEPLALDDLATSYSQLKQFEQAYAKLKLSRSLADSLNDLERENRLQELETQFDTRLKEQQIDNLRIQETKSNRIILYQRLIIAFSFVALLIIGFLLFIQRRQTLLILKQKDEMHILNQNKDRFFSIIAHDLRSPFNSILGLLDLMVDSENKLSQAELEKHLSSLEKTANSTFTLLQNQLNWARTQMDNMPVELKAISISTIIQEQSRFLHAQLIQKGIQLVHLDRRDFDILCDQDMLSFIVRNILGNAIKFTPECKEIGIECKVENSFGIIKIIDQGVGISENQIQKLFDIGTGNSTRGTNGEKGSGLGLPLSMAFAKKMGGHVSITSQPDQGTEVSIYLPIA